MFISKKHAVGVLKISLNNKSKIVHNKIRALTPKPGAYLLFNNKGRFLDFSVEVFLT